MYHLLIIFIREIQKHSVLINKKIISIFETMI